MVTASQRSKAEALREAASALQELTADLSSLGGVQLDAQTERAPLTWSAQSATTWAESDHNKTTGISEPTGRVIASVSVLVTVRDFATLDPLGAVLATHQTLHVHQVSWQVDPGNPGWAQVRTTAIDAAIAKGRDYATALGGSLHEVLHIADVGLLEGDGRRVAGTARGLANTMFSGSGGAPAETPSLDPVPQELTATVEARFLAVGVVLTDS